MRSASVSWASDDIGLEFSFEMIVKMTYRGGVVIVITPLLLGLVDLVSMSWKLVLEIFLYYPSLSPRDLK
jgi:hypothetical protein